MKKPGKKECENSPAVPHGGGASSESPTGYGCYANNGINTDSGKNEVDFMRIRVYIIYSMYF